MKRQMNYSQLIKALLMAVLLTLGFKTMAQEQRENWTPTDVAYDGNGNPYAAWNDPANWQFGIVPTLQDTNDDTYSGDYWAACFNDPAGGVVPCLVTNDTTVGHLFLGLGGSGEVIVTNANGLPGGVQLQAGFEPGGQWTGIGYVSGPATLYVAPGCDFSCGSHLWVGQGVKEGGASTDVGTVIVNGGTLHVPSGQLGVGWNGNTNDIYITNFATLYLQQWVGQTLGYPAVNTNEIGIMDIGIGSSVVASNNVTTYTVTVNGQSVNLLNCLETNNQLLGYEGTGSVSASYNPALGITTVISVPPFTPGLTPVVNSNPVPVVAEAGGTASFSVNVTNVSVNYLWLFDDTPLSNGNGISGATTPTLTVANVTSAESGVYSCVVTNSSNTSYSASSASASLSTYAFNLYPVVAINGINGDTYVVEYTSSLTPPVTWTPLATNTVGAGTQYFVDTSTPRALSRFYQVVQQ